MSPVLTHSDVDRLFRPVVERLYLLSKQYKSTYLFVHELSLFEIMCEIMRKCIEAGYDDQENCCQDVKVDREKIHSMFDEYVRRFKGEWVSVPQTRMIVTLRYILEHIRVHDVTGQLLQSIGLLHLWSQYRSKPKFGRITSSDIIMLHHFIQGHYGHFLQSVILVTEDDPKVDGIVYLAKDFTFELFNQVFNHVDSAIANLVFNWPSKIASIAARVPLVPTLASLSDDDEDKPKRMTFPEQQEALGRIYLHDYIARRHARRIESSIDLCQNDSASLSIDRTNNISLPSPPIRINQLPPNSTPKEEHSVRSGTSAQSDQNAFPIDSMSFKEKSLLLAKIQSEIKTMTAFICMPANETERSLSSLDSFNLSMLESYASDDDDDEDAPSCKTLQLIDALVTGGLKSRKRPPFGKGKGALPPPSSKAGQNNKKMPFTKGPLSVVNQKEGATAQQKSSKPTSENFISTKSAKGFKDGIFCSDYGGVNMCDDDDKDGNKKVSDSLKKETKGSEKKGQIFQGETASEATDFLMGTSSNSKTLSSETAKKVEKRQQKLQNPTEDNESSKK